MIYASVTKWAKAAFRTDNTNGRFGPDRVSSPPQGFCACGERLVRRAASQHLDRSVKGSLSNWVFGSSSFSFAIGIFVAHPGHASLRSLFDATWGIAARMCPIGSGEPCLETCFKWRSSHFRLHPRTSSGEDDPVQIGVGRLDHAMPSTFSGRNSVPSVDMRWSRTASFRATATTARRRPLVRIKRMPHDLICDPAIVRISNAFAAA